MLSSLSFVSSNRVISFLNNIFIITIRLCWVSVAARELLIVAHRFSSCVWILVPQPGIKPVSPASDGRFLGTKDATTKS